jgi:hypothetical protein
MVEQHFASVLLCFSPLFIMVTVKVNGLGGSAPKITWQVIKKVRNGVLKFGIHKYLKYIYSFAILLTLGIYALSPRIQSSY